MECVGRLDSEAIDYSSSKDMNFEIYVNVYLQCH